MPATTALSGERRAQRRSNEERRAHSRAAVLDATITAIVRFGYHGATSERIAELSGFTRGAQKHHFRNKAEMVAEAVERLHDQMAHVLIERLRTSADAGLSAQLEFSWELCQSDLYLAMVELHTAARRDEELRAALRPAQRHMLEQLMGAGQLFWRNQKVAPERLLLIGQLVFNAMRGMAFDHMLAPNPGLSAVQLQMLNEAVQALLRAG